MNGGQLMVIEDQICLSLGHGPTYGYGTMLVIKSLMQQKTLSISRHQSTNQIILVKVTLVTVIPGKCQDYG